tara:strand:- start:2282 stop:4681 length:2400 start_codon:yes stop_codon:yes gene_type:complete
VAEKLKQTIEFQAKGIQKLKGQYKDLERRTKGLEGSTKGAGGAMGGMVAKLGLTTVALYAASRAISAVVRVGKEFEKNMSNVAAISGAAGQELAALEQNAKKLGSTTVFTASQVAGLQVEFAKLGFSSKEIRGVTKGTLALASATGSELSIAAAVAGQTLRAFGLDVSETGTVTDAMAASFSSSALDMDKFANSMQYVAPIAKQVGFSVQDTTAILGTLANAGISGSMAGTSLRKILLELGNENSKLTKKIGFSVKSSDDLQRALSKLSAEGIGTAEMKEMVGQRAISAFNILMEGTETTKELTTALNDSGGAAQKMADTQLDNLEGKTTLLNSAMEGLGIVISERLNAGLVEVTESFTSFATSLTKIIEIPLSSKIREEQIEFNALIGALKDVNINQESRQTHLNTLMSKYPNYIKNLDIESLSIDQLSKIQKTANDEFLRKIELTAKEEILAERKAKMLKAQIAIQEQELIVNKEVDEFMQGLVFGMVGEIDTKKASNEVDDLKIKRLQQLREDSERLTKEYQAAVDVLGKYKQATDEASGSVETFAGSVEGAEGGSGGGTEDKKSFQDEFTKQELAIYQQYLSQRKSITTLSREEEEIALDTQHTKLKEMLEGQGKELIALEKFVADSKEAIALKHFNNMMGVYSQFASGFSAFLGEFAGSQKASARMAQVAATIDTYAAANTALKTVQPYPLNVAAAAGIVASGLANVMQISKGIGEFKSAETGYSGVVDRPTMFMTGENNKAEQVSITPLESPNIAGAEGGGGITINVSAPLVDESIIDSILPAIARAQQMELA